MADEAFALSPISARASLPSEEDYEAIREAFMETSRGRWFLSEYARRNRNADTCMVLDAVARIEESLAAHRQPARGSGLAEALSVIGRALEEARSAASAALDSLALEENLAPVRKSARVIKEISWRWREIGADGRAGSEIAAEKPELAVAPVQPATTQPSHPLSLEVSLGSTLIANGIVRRPHAAGLDPLAPIRRMSQAEKIAFFSWVVDCRGQGE
jgi:hypothetical protein